MFRGRSRVARNISLAWVIGCCLFTGAASISTAQDPDVKPKVGFGIALTGPGGLYTYRPHRWGVLHVNVVNRKEEPLEMFSTTFFDDEPTLQYGRKVWLPPRSRLRTWHPAKIPALPADGKNTVFFHSLVMNSNDDKEVLIRTDASQMQHDGFLKATTETVTGLINDLDGRSLSDSTEAMELLYAGRIKQALSKNISTLTDDIFIPCDENLQPLDQLVICDSRPMRDGAGLSAIRRWLHAGGHLWIMLDQVDPAMLEMLLGDTFQCEVVDRVSLTHVNIKEGPAGPHGVKSDFEFELPVDLVRTIVSDVEVAFTVNGWPAAFWKNYGSGRLLVTTLGPRGWLQRRVNREPVVARQRGVPQAPPSQTPPPQAGPMLGPNLDIGSCVPNEPMETLCTQFWSARKEDALNSEALEPIVQEYVGYAIPSRWMIVGLLSGFSGLLAVAGIALWRRGQLEWLGAVGPCLAVVVSLVLVSIGLRQRQSVAPTAANLQFIHAIEGTDDFLAEGQLGLFSPESGMATLAVHDDGYVTPDMAGLEGTTRRMIWTDQEQWHWQNLPMTAGSRNATFRKSGEMSHRVTATAMFGPDGLAGRVTTDVEHPPEDALIATTNGRLGVELNADGTLQAPSSGVFTREQFISANLVSDEQNRRGTALRHLLTNPKRRDYPAKPVLLYWTKPWDLGFEFAKEAQTLGSALVEVPLELQRPPSGTEVSIAAPFVPFKAVTGPDGMPPTGLWDPLRQEWAEKFQPSSTWLKFTIPRVLLPVQTIGGKIVVRVIGPMGKLELAGANQGQAKVLKTWTDPVGTLEFPITDGKSFAINDAGEFLLRIGGGDPSRPELTMTKTNEGDKTNYWRIESLAVELRVKTD